MWWLFTGALTGVIWGWISWRRQWGAWTDGEHRKLAGLDVFWSERYLRGSGSSPLLLRRVLVGVPVPKHGRFELKLESAADRFFKWTGLSVEHQVGQSDLDNLLYIGGDGDLFVEKLAAERDAHRTLVELFTTRLAGCSLKRVRCAQGRLWVELTRVDLSDNAEVLSHMLRSAEQLLPLLERFAQVLRSGERPSVAPASRDPFVASSILLLAISTGLMASGLISFFLVGMGESEVRSLERGRLLGMSGLLAFILWLGLLGLHTILMRGSSRFHLILVEVSLTGGFGLLVLCGSLLGHINRSHDASAPELQFLEIQGKETSKGRRGGTSHYLRIEHPADHRLETTWAVSPALYAQAEKGDLLELHRFQGYLGVAWVRRVGLRPRLPPDHLNL
jgi:hypothetical protein